MTNRALADCVYLLELWSESSCRGPWLYPEADGNILQIFKPVFRPGEQRVCHPCIGFCKGTGDRAFFVCGG